MILPPEFKSAAILSALPVFDSLEFKGESQPKVLHFQGTVQTEPVSLYALSFIRRDEAFIWKSFQEMLDHAAKLAAAGMRGIFGFEILSLDTKKGMQHFQPSKYAELLVNHSKKLQPGQAVIVPYGSLFGILKKRVPEDWGKLDLKVNVEVLSKEPGQLDLMVKRLVKDVSGKTVVMLQDLSGEPVFRFGSEPQTERLAAYLEKIKDRQADLEILIQDKSGCTELFSQFGLRESHV